MITLHTIVKNEDRFIKAALISALASKDVKRALVWDTGSTDNTVQEILSIKDPRIEFIEKGNVSRKKLALLRNEQLEITKTPWILLVDGDEIWPEKNLQNLILTMKKCLAGPDPTLPDNNVTIALVNRTRNVVGDIYHYLPESKGHYQIGSWTGHLNIRAIRNLSGLIVKGGYPDEWYELDGVKIQEYPSCLSNKESPCRTARRLLNRRQEFCLQFVDTWYLHATHLKRSSSWMAEFKTIDRLKKHKWFYGLTGLKLIEMNKSELPEVLQKF